MKPISLKILGILCLSTLLAGCVATVRDGRYVRPARVYYSSDYYPYYYPNRYYSTYYTYPNRYYSGYDYYNYPSSSFLFGISTGSDRSFHHGGHRSWRSGGGHGGGGHGHHR